MGQKVNPIGLRLALNKNWSSRWYAAKACFGDWLLMVASVLPLVGSIIYFVFIWGDIKLWKLGLKYINKQQENSRRQAQEAKATDLEYQIRQAIHDYDSEYKRIDWGAGDRR